MGGYGAAPPSPELEDMGQPPELLEDVGQNGRIWGSPPPPELQDVGQIAAQPLSCSGPHGIDCKPSLGVLPHL